MGMLRHRPHESNVLVVSFLKVFPHIVDQYQSMSIDGRSTMFGNTLRNKQITFDSYIPNFKSQALTVLEIFCLQTDTHTDTHTDQWLKLWI
jgi:hypothetical protein